MNSPLPASLFPRCERWPFGAEAGIGGTPLSGGGKTLLLMRHAKSDWAADYSGDHERPLNRRGVRSARLMGGALAARGLAPQLVISSTATRAASTARLADEAGGWDADLRFDPALYDSGPDEVLEAASAAPNVARLMIVGHQPTWSMLVRRLTGDSVEMKTATVAIVELDIAHWTDLLSADGRLVEVLNPRDIVAVEDRESN